MAGRPEVFVSGLAEGGLLRPTAAERDTSTAGGMVSHTYRSELLDGERRHFKCYVGSKTLRHSLRTSSHFIKALEDIPVY